MPTQVHIYLIKSRATLAATRQNLTKVSWNNILTSDSFYQNGEENSFKATSVASSLNLAKAS